MPDQSVLKALEADRIVDITTNGRKTGEPRRIEIGLWTLPDGHAITGRPGRPRSWYANLRARPEFTVHVKRGAQADLPARATPVTEESEKRRILSEIARRSENQIDVETWVAQSPLVRVEFL